ncbi:ubiquinol oxidase subunit II [Allorhizobium sp. BGMRC 0089]|uniref:ubiquinol oxidase subunit II n=1 Tax=Allorhizobium sonneratiae TaxID=2934936 RepID=UPI0020337DF4|nr:ubiquinol oxidase subunit II [Allorhizobium sonneratiae]MCM2293823.1 ubiquinol oxidase subunit II [Allorhizobium sonneratiae]
MVMEDREPAKIQSEIETIGGGRTRPSNSLQCIRVLTRRHAGGAAAVGIATDSLPIRRPPPLPLSLATLARFRPLLLLALPLFLSGCSALSVLNPAGPSAEGDKVVLLNAVTIMLAIVIPTIIGCLVFAWWFRASNTQARRRPDFVYSGRIELLVWSIPTLAIIFLGGIIWVGSHQLDPAHPVADQRPLEIEVVSMNWKWLFIYPSEGVATVNHLVIPAGRPVRFSLTSATVMNSFFIPRLGGMIATMAGMVTHLNVMANHPATFTGRSTQFSGQGFADMHFKVDARSPADFNTWLTTARNDPRTLDKAGFAALTKPSTIKAPLVYGKVAPDLFRTIVDQEPTLSAANGE